MSLHATSGTVSDSLRELGRQAIEHGVPISRLAPLLGLSLADYRPLPDERPLCFLHIPKTAGAAIIAWLKSMFPPGEVAPYTVEEDFAQICQEPQKYRLYCGHITGRLLRYLPRQTQLWTINRDPVERALSEYYWVLSHYPELLAARPELREVRDDPGGIVTTLEFFHSVDLATALSTDTRDMRVYFRDRVLRQFGGLAREDDWELADSSPTLHRVTERRWQRAQRLLAAFSVVGDYADIEVAALLLAVTRGWPAPPQLPRIHDVGAPTARLAAEAKIRDIVRARNAGDFRLYDLTSARAAALRPMLQERCGGADPSAVNRHHAERFFASTTRVVAFDQEADAPRNGSGWDFARHDGQGAPYRLVQPGRRGSTLVLLDPGIGDYLVFCHVLNGSSQAVIEALSVTVAGVPLARTACAPRPWAGAPALVVSWRLPRELVARIGGRVEFVFATEQPESGAPQLGRIGCVPLPGGE